MPRDLKLLDRIEIATPCKADWGQMSGDERVRFCGMCRLNVYNLSGMSRADGEAFLRKAEGRVCVRLFKREDGTVLTQDCPIGIRIARRLRRTASLVAASLAGALGLTAFFGRPLDEGPSLLARLWYAPVAKPLMGKPQPLMGTTAVPRNFVPQQPGREIMGDVSIPVRETPAPRAPQTPESPEQLVR